MKNKVLAIFLFLGLGLALVGSGLFACEKKVEKVAEEMVEEVADEVVDEVVDEVAEVKPAPYFFEYKKFWQLYEFHPDYAKISSFHEVITKYEGDYIFPGSPSLYETKDAYDLLTSDNVRLTKQSKYKVRWRGVVYERLDLELKPIQELKKGDSFSYWISFKSKRLPFLHTMETITPEKDLHLGINLYPPSTGKHYRIVALPIGTEIDSVFHYLPSKRIETKDWIFFIYDISDIEDNVSLHIKFTLSSDSTPLEFRDAQDILKEIE